MGEIYSELSDCVFSFPLGPEHPVMENIAIVSKIMHFKVFIFRLFSAKYVFSVRQVNSSILTHSR